MLGSYLPVLCFWDHCCSEWMCRFNCGPLFPFYLNVVPCINVVIFDNKTGGIRGWACVTTRKCKLAKSWSVVRCESEFGAADRKKER